jgi:MFS family permease
MSVETQEQRTASSDITQSSIGTHVLVMLCVMYLLLYVDRVNIATAAPKIKLDLHLTNGQFGMAVSAFSYPYAILQLAGGWISDRFGVRWVLALCVLGVCLVTALTGAVVGLSSLIAVRAALGLGEGIAFPTATRALASWLPKERWGFAQGITHSAARFGNALAPPLIVSIMLYSSWRWSFYGVGLLGLLWVMIWLLTTRRAASTPAPEPNTQRSASNGRDSISWIQLARRIAPVTAVDFCYGWTLWVFLTWLPLFFYEHFHLDLGHSAFFSAAVLIAGIVGDALGGVITDALYKKTRDLRVARRNLIIAGFLGAFCFLLPVLYLHTLSSVVWCLTGACFCSELIVAPIWAIPMDLAPRNAGTASGMMNFGFGLAGILSPLLFGKLLDATGAWKLPFTFSLVLLLAGVALSFFIRWDVAGESKALA